jgi:hypothetical protein
MALSCEARELDFLLAMAPVAPDLLLAGAVGALLLPDLRFSREAVCELLRSLGTIGANALAATSSAQMHVSEPS